MESVVVFVFARNEAISFAISVPMICRVCF
jgi:hypothetical protein